MVGIVVGAGIFKAPSLVAKFTGSPEIMMAAWIVGGVISIIGALCYAELASAHPNAGGEYHFLQRAFGRQISFLYGWARLTVVVAGSIAVFSYLFGDYMSRVINLGTYSSAIWAAFIVTALTLVNYAGIREGKATQNLFTVLEVSGLVLIVVAGLIFAPTPAAVPSAVAAAGDGPWYMGAGLGTAMLFVLFDIEVIFFVPWAAVLRHLRAGGTEYVVFALGEMAVFAGFLALGYAYIIKKRALEWEA